MNGKQARRLDDATHEAWRSLCDRRCQLPETERLYRKLSRRAKAAGLDVDALTKGSYDLGERAMILARASNDAIIARLKTKRSRLKVRL